MMLYKELALRTVQGTLVDTADPLPRFNVDTDKHEERGRRNPNRMTNYFQRNSSKGHIPNIQGTNVWTRNYRLNRGRVNANALVKIVVQIGRLPMYIQCGAFRMWPPLVNLASQNPIEAKIRAGWKVLNRRIKNHRNIASRIVISPISPDIVNWNFFEVEQFKIKQVNYFITYRLKQLVMSIWYLMECLAESFGRMGC